MKTKTLILLIFFTQGSICLGQEAIEEDFNQYFHEWQEQSKTIISSETSDYCVLPAFQKILELGLPAVPLMMQKIKEEGMGTSLRMIFGIRKLTKKLITIDSMDINEISEYDEKYIHWWDRERSEVRKNFNQLYEQWNQLSDSEKMKKEYINERNLEYVKQWRQMPDGPEKERLHPYKRTVYQEILDMGIFALPYVVEKVAQGDTDLIEAINYWTDDALAAAVQEAGVEAENLTEFVPQWWEENREQWTLPERNTE